MGKKGVLKRDEVERLIGEGKKWDSHKKLQRAFPQFAEKSVSDEELAEAKAKDPTIDTKEKLVVSKMKPPDYKNISDGALDDIRVVDAILSKAMGQHISQLIEGKGRQAAEALERQIWEKAEAEGVKPEEYLQKQNPKLHRYLIAGAGRGLIDFTKKPELKPKEEPKKESEEVKEPIPPWGGRKEKKY